MAIHEPHDLILVDVLLGQTRAGYDLVRELRSQGDSRPVVAVTGLALSYDLEQCYEAGFTDILVKPYDMQQLASLLHKYEGSSNL